MVVVTAARYCLSPFNLCCVSVRDPYSLFCQLCFPMLSLQINRFEIKYPFESKSVQGDFKAKWLP